MCSFGKTRLRSHPDARGPVDEGTQKVGQADPRRTREVGKQAAHEMPAESEGQLFGLTHLSSDGEGLDIVGAKDAALAAVWKSASSDASMSRDFDLPKALFLPDEGG